MNKLLILSLVILVVPVAQNWTQAIDCSIIQQTDYYFMCLGLDLGYVLALNHISHPYIDLPAYPN